MFLKLRDLTFVDISPYCCAKNVDILKNLTGKYIFSIIKEVSENHCGYFHEKCGYFSFFSEKNRIFKIRL